MKKINEKTVIKAAYLAGGLATAAHFVVRGAIPCFKKSNDKCVSTLSSVVATVGTIVAWPVYLAGMLRKINSPK